MINEEDNNNNSLSHERLFSIEEYSFIPKLDEKMKSDLIFSSQVKQRFIHARLMYTHFADVRKEIILIED